MIEATKEEIDRIKRHRKRNKRYYEAFERRYNRALNDVYDILSGKVTTNSDRNGRLIKDLLEFCADETADEAINAVSKLAEISDNYIMYGNISLGEHESCVYGTDEEPHAPHILRATRYKLEKFVRKMILEADMLETANSTSVSIDAEVEEEKMPIE
jgi:hypothetical protein